jgi:putative ABC transport system ATP-binding protein
VAERLHRFFHAGDEEVQALRDVSFEARAGELVAVTGPSGSGKSTLLAALAGLDDPDGGTVWIAGTRLSRRTEAERAKLRAQHIGVLYQASNLVEHLSVRENVLLAQAVLGAVDRTRADSILAEVGLADRRLARPSQLSGGELARAGLAVALANDPDVVLADEPTGEVDHRTEQRVIEVLSARAQHGAAVVILTHSTAVARAAGREVRMRDGAVVA